MAALSTIIGAVGLGLAAAGTGIQVVGQMQASAASERAENLRQRQMDLETARQRRGVIRQALRARSMALFNANEQGAGQGSGISGGLGQIGGQAASNMQGINQGAEIGTAMFQANRDLTGAQTLASFGAGLSSLGGSIYGGSDTLGRVGQYLTQR